MIYDKILKEKQRVETQIETLQTKLKDFPEGKLVCTKNGKYNKWYCSTDSSYTYIPKKEYELAEKLAHKTYLLLQLKTLLNEKMAIDSYLKHYQPDTSRKEQDFITSPEYKDFLSSYFTPLSQELVNWMNAPYETNKICTENVINKTPSGHCVRSKSEAMIDMCLYKNNIAFRYECLLQLDKHSLFPDFTIRHPKTGKVYYWEHFGLMDDTTYAQKTYSKLAIYTSHGIIPSINLITTYETKDHPLSADMIEKIVNYYFLEN